MDTLKRDLDDLNCEIVNLKNQIADEKLEAESNIKPLKAELSRVKQDKTRYAAKGDLESVQICRRREENLKFKINAQWNKYSSLKNSLTNLNKQKIDLENQIKLKEDQLKRKNEILAQMNKVLNNYKKTQDLKKSAIDSNINPNHVEQWLEWGKNNFNDTYAYFYNKITEIDECFRDLKTKELKDRMDTVIDAYKKTGSLKEASRLAGVSCDTVQYWYEWGSRGFGEENAYFFNKIMNHQG